MTYSSATGSYQADFLENILNTDYKYGVPYKIDRDKYESVMKAFSKEVRIKDADVVVFHVDYNKDEEDPSRGIYSCAFYAWPQNSPKGSDDFYDCSQFWDYEYNYKHKEEFEKFVLATLESIIGPDQECLKKLIKEKQAELKVLNENVSELIELLL